jgi:hypothetical protein
MSQRQRLRPRVTLTQLLVSIAILAFPMGLYATELRESPGRHPDIALLIGSLAAHCVELEAFFWLILAPRFGRLLAHWRARQPVADTDDGVWTDGDTPRVFRWFGPCYAVIAPLSGLAVGYRGYLSILGLVFVISFLAGLVLIPLGLVYLTVQFIRRPRSFAPPMLSGSLLFLAIPCSFSFWTAVNIGWRQLERESGLPRLARECVLIFKSPAVPPAGKVPEGLLQTPAMRRLRPTHVTVASDRYLKIELHGGFDHYGYLLNRDTSNQRWELHRYGDNTAFGPGETRPLLIWPIGSEP